MLNGTLVINLDNLSGNGETENAAESAAYIEEILSDPFFGLTD